MSKSENSLPEPGESPADFTSVVHGGEPLSDYEREYIAEMEKAYSEAAQAALEKVKAELGLLSE